MNERKNISQHVDADSGHGYLLGLTTDLVSAYVANNETARETLPALIQEVFLGLSSIRHNYSSRLGAPIPAVPIEDSITPDHIICLEDGKKLKMIKRHLRAVYGMSLDEYRQRWGLPNDYPAVAPSYAKQRSQLAKVIGLGVNGRRKKAS